MKFYNRTEELAKLKQIDKQTNKSGKITVLTGRRRVGKTELALQFANSLPFIYLFVGRKSEYLLCQEYIEEISSQFDLPIIGKITQFKEVFALILEIAKRQKLTLIIDEFQDFYRCNPAIYSDIQKLWDLHKKKVALHIIFSGSIYSLMHKIFEDKKEPLFGRADQILNLSPFSIKTMREIATDENMSSPKNLLDLFVFTGGLPKYIEILLNYQAKSFDDIVDLIMSADSFFLNEGMNVLIEEFGKNYGIYFSILELISYGKASRPEMESILQKDLGGYLEKLHKDYAIIAPRLPINAKPQSRQIRYRIEDNFLNFWFYFIYAHRSAVEIGNFDYLKRIINKQYANYCGRMLERFFHQLFAETRRYNRIGQYWEKGHQNEIDLVAINDLEKTMIIAEIKLNKKKINLDKLKAKSKKLVGSFKAYTVKYKALSIEDILGY